MGKGQFSELLATNVRTTQLFSKGDVENRNNDLSPVKWLDLKSREFPATIQSFLKSYTYDQTTSYIGRCTCGKWKTDPVSLIKNEPYEPPNDTRKHRRLSIT